MFPFVSIVPVGVPMGEGESHMSLSPAAPLQPSRRTPGSSEARTGSKEKSIVCTLSRHPPRESTIASCFLYFKSLSFVHLPFKVRSPSHCSFPIFLRFSSPTHQLLLELASASLSRRYLSICQSCAPPTLLRTLAYKPSLSHGLCCMTPGPVPGSLLHSLALWPLGRVCSFLARWLIGLIGFSNLPT